MGSFLTHLIKYDSFRITYYVPCGYSVGKINATLRAAITLVKAAAGCAPLRAPSGFALGPLRRACPASSYLARSSLVCC